MVSLCSFPLFSAWTMLNFPSSGLHSTMATWCRCPHSTSLPHSSSSKPVLLRTLNSSSVSTKIPICCIQKASSVTFVFFLLFNIKLTEYKYILIGFGGIDNKWLNKGKVSCLNYPQNEESFNHLIPQKSTSSAQEMKHWIAVYNRHTYPPKTVEVNSPLLHSCLL